MTEHIEEIDQLIKSGSAGLAKQRLAQISRKDIPRRHLAKVAGLFRRVAEPLIGIKILNPIVRSDFILSQLPTIHEKAEYAICLNSLGAYKEAQILLREDGILNQFPPAHLYMAASFVSQWDYQNAIPYILAFIEMAQTDYERLLGKLNYVPSLIYTKKYDEALVVAKEIIEHAKDYQLIAGNAQELLGQIYFYKKKHDLAKHHLEVAQELLSKSVNREKLYVGKWMAINNIWAKGMHQDAVEQLLQIRDDSIKNKQWENERDCELFLAVATEDEDLLHKVYFGTPHHSYRNRILDFWSRLLPNVFKYSLYSNLEENVLIDTHTGHINGIDLGMHRSSLVHKTFKILSKDLYRPIPQAEMFTLLYGDEYFNPLSSPQKILNSISRLRGWFKNNSVPLEVKEDLSCYKLSATAPIQLLYHLDTPSKDLLVTKDEATLREVFGNTSFHLEDAAKILGVSTKSISRRMKTWVSAGKIKTSRKGRRINYHFETES